jgi:hypothetical protein
LTITPDKEVMNDAGQSINLRRLYPIDLIVNDDENVLELLAEGLKRFGFNVFKTQDGPI